VSDESLRVLKREHPVTLWLPAEGRMDGAVFVWPETEGRPTGESPADVFNSEEPFVAVKRYAPDHVQLYRKSAIARVEFQPRGARDAGDSNIGCSVRLDDGASVRGRVREVLPEARQRLLDHLNRDAAAFLRLFLEDGGIALLNKLHIVRVTEED